MKYSIEVGDFLSKTSSLIKNKIVDAVGQDFINAVDEYNTCKAKLEKARQEYYNSDEYKKLQDDMVYWKDNLLASIDEDEKSYNKKMLAKTIAKIETSNVIIKNRNKPVADRMKELLSQIGDMPKEKQKNLENLKKEIANDIKQNLLKIIVEYKSKVDALRQKYDIKEEDDELQLDFSVVEKSYLGKYKDFFNTVQEKYGHVYVDDDRTYIVSDTNDGIKN